MRTAPGRKKLTLLQRVAQRLRLRPTPLGDRGEAHAAKFLRKQGMKIIAHNRTHGRGEIDLIAIDADHLVFIEVRTRTSPNFMTPEGSIRYHKRRKLISTVRALLRTHGRAGLTPRIDVVAIIWPKDAKHPTDVRHHRGVIPVASW
jgi:putative endonuclease